MIEFEKLQIGQSLPEKPIPITARLIVSGAIASQDFEDVHHDKAAANGKGTPDIFMNILTTNGIVGSYLTEWSGPAYRIHRIALKLGAPNFPGDTKALFCARRWPETVPSSGACRNAAAKIPAAAERHRSPRQSRLDCLSRWRANDRSSTPE